MLSPVQTWLLEGGSLFPQATPSSSPRSRGPLPGVFSRICGIQGPAGCPRHSAVCKCLDVRASGARILREGRPAKFKVLFFLITSTAGIIQRQPEALAFMRPSTSPATEQILKVPGENGSANG